MGEARAQMGFWEKTKGFLLSPTETFNNVKTEGWGGSIAFFAKWLIIWAIIVTVIGAVIFGWILSTVPSWGEVIPGLDPAQVTALLSMFAGVMVVALGIIAIVGGIIVILIGSLWMHIWVYVCGGRKGVGETIKAMAYGYTPVFLFGWIPIIGIVFSIWSLAIQVVGFRQLHEISTGRALLAYLLGAIIIPVIIVAIFFAALISALIGLMPPA